MKTIKVKASKAYDVVISENILDKIGELCPVKACKAAVISDDKVFGIYGKRLVEALEKSGFTIISHTFKNGERSKNITEYARILEFLAENQLTRSDCIFALGGGVCGDMSGFAAATYLRGIRFVQIPTTFLAAVDSSVGGKTGVNLQSGKNLAGAFHQPEMVLCDTKTFETLDEGVFSDGVAEAVKCGMIKSKDLFLKMGKDFKKDIESVVASCVEIKRSVVEEDEFDLGLRQLLNFGHTIGHTIEKLSNFSVTHGHAVAIGMAVITKAAYKTGVCDESVYDELIKTLKICNLPTECSFSAEEIYKTAMSDKKRTGDTITLVLPKSIGECVLEKISTADLYEFIRKGLE